MESPLTLIECLPLIRSSSPSTSYNLVDFAVIDARDMGHVLYLEHVEIEQFKAEFDFWGSVIGLFEFVKGTLHGEGI